MNTHEIEFCYRMRHPVSPCTTNQLLPAATLDSLEGDVLDPSLSQVVVRIAPYTNMACGDRLLLSWEGLDIEGFVYQHEKVRYVSAAQVGKDVIFVIKGMHVAALDGGALDIYWTLASAGLPEPALSAPLQLTVGDTRAQLLAPQVEGAISGTLDPARVVEGVLVTLQPYGKMAVGDQVSLMWSGDASPLAFSDRLKVEAFAVAETLSFWVPAEYIAAHLGGEVTVRYRVEQANGAVRESDTARVLVTPFLQSELDAPDVLEAEDGVLLAEDSTDGVTVVIGNARTQEGELVYLKCDGDFFSHRDDRDITRETAGKPLIFIVPQRFWREHQGSTVRVSYTVERLDDVSQASAATQVRVEA
ncbi:hypothetical protein C1893_02495 [Pseudomonas sp. MPR-ANC1]|uniref:hypothetical protein n=1 Tax=Pseudomonas sp. MPR-ANC1 TaxID=2075548 RepID=UPI000CD06B7E|nr:hypothetical protein [Pseudomonas sp. MPR-ANC1]POA50431.1 hypothetical protein C1893_02495 [Pseudomonas sp. MPR-ANC1]